MKRILYLNIAFLLCLLLNTNGFAKSPEYFSAKSRDKGTLLVSNFLNAMFTGNMSNMRGALKGNLREKNSRLFKKSSYSRSLRETFKNASFKILDYKFLSEDLLQIDVQINVSKKEWLQFRYILEKDSSTPDDDPQFLIYSQTEITK